MDRDYDEYYNAKVNRRFSRNPLSFVIPLILIITSLFMIAITLTDMYVSMYNFGQTQTNSNFVYTWDENPFWPSYGKGFWVGLIVLVTGIIGIVAFSEHTITSVYAYIVLLILTAIFSFYLVVTSSIPIAKYVELGGVPVVLGNFGRAYYNSLALNAVLLCLGVLAFLLACISALFSCCHVGCCSEKRGYSSTFIDNYYKTLPGSSIITTRDQIKPNASTSFGVLNPAFK